MCANNCHAAASPDPARAIVDIRHCFSSLLCAQQQPHERVGRHFLLIRRLEGMIDLVAKGALKVAVPIQEPATGA